MWVPTSSEHGKGTDVARDGSDVGAQGQRCTGDSMVNSVGNLTEDEEMEQFVVAIPGSFNMDCGAEAT